MKIIRHYQRDAVYNMCFQTYAEHDVRIIPIQKKNMEGDKRTYMLFYFCVIVGTRAESVVSLTFSSIGRSSRFIGIHHL